MAIESVSIHPAIGIARVGDSPDEFFIGPERPGAKPDPEDGFKDGECRVKRQAARFRIFASHDDGSVEELTDDDADIEWTVHLANKKAVSRNSTLSDADYTIDPGAESVDGPNERAAFDGGDVTFQGDSGPVTETVPLGEIRTDTQGRLLVLGGAGDAGSPTGRDTHNTFHNQEWYDDTSDGPVEAEVTISGETHTAEGAWVVVCPPKFAPALDNVITLYDRLFHLMANEGYVSPPSTPSYTEDVHPIIDRAKQAEWVTPTGLSTHDGSLGTGGGTWSEPIYEASARQRVFEKLKDPSSGGGNMPPLADGTDHAHLTGTQHQVMEKWKDGNFTEDWTGAPEVPDEVTPEGMDEAALENGVGAAMYPGIEVGGFSGTRVILDPANYTGAFRLDHAALGPGELTRYMALPWQTDFLACDTAFDEFWWPVARPIDVFLQGDSSRSTWDRNVPTKDSMVNNWSDLGFVVEQGDRYEAVDECGTPYITLLTPSIEFRDVPQGPMGTARTTRRAIEFEVSAPSGSVTLEVQSHPSHPRLTIDDPTAGPVSGGDVQKVRIWVTYQTGMDGESITDSVTVENPDDGETWEVAVTASTVGRRTGATALVLDRSGSMDEDRGDGLSKHESLQKAASIFVDAMLEDDGVAVVRYNQDADELQGVETVGSAGGPDPVRTDTKSVITGPGLDPDGTTSIGDGIQTGRASLADASGFDVESLLVLTDGKENSPAYIADVAGAIDEQTYSVGLGTPENTSAPALQTISGNNGGYLLMTGDIDQDDEFVLQKYFVQVLAGISNAEVVLDPEGELRPGAEHRVPFGLTDVDSGLDVYLLTDDPYQVDFRLQTPNGHEIEPWRARADPTMRWVISDDLAYYRLSLPTVVRHDRYEREGRWHALLELGRPNVKPDEDEWEEYGELRERVAETDAPADEGWATRREARSVVREPDRAAETRDNPAYLASRLPAAQSRADGLRYSLVVHTYSDLSLDATVQQTGYEPGADLRLEAVLTESDAPVEEASAWVDVTRPDGASTRVELDASGDGRFDGTVGTTAPGVYRLRVQARGRTRHGLPFQREELLTGAVWYGGDQDAKRTQRGGGGPGADRRLCDLLKCLLGSEEGLGDELEERLGVDPDSLRKCLRAYCRGPTGVETESQEVELTRRIPQELLGELDRLVSGYDFEP